MPKNPKNYTIRDVARKAGVGVGTVSRVLNGSPLVSEDTRMRVLAVIGEMDFRPSPVARRLSLGKTLTIGVALPFFTRPAFVGRLEGVEAALGRSKYELVLFNVETPDQYMSLLFELPRERRVDGLIIMALRPTDDHVEGFRAAKLPVVLVDSDHPELSSIRIDDVDGGRLATEHLVLLGHSRIAFVGDYLTSPFGFGATAERLTGYRQVLHEHNLPFRQEYWKQGTHGRHIAHRLTEELLALDEPPTAIVAASDTQALGVIEAIRQAGLDVPGDISVTGYDDIEAAAYVGLTTVHQPLYESGVDGVDLLLEIMDAKNADSPPESYILPVTLIVRNTTAPLIQTAESPP